MQIPDHVPSLPQTWIEKGGGESVAAKEPNIRLQQSSPLRASFLFIMLDKVTQLYKWSGLLLSAGLCLAAVLVYYQIPQTFILFQNNKWLSGFH